MKKILQISILILSILALIAVFWTVISYQHIRYFFISTGILSILFLVRVIKYKLQPIRILLRVLLFLSLNVFIFFCGILLFVIQEKVCQSDKPQDFNYWKQPKEIDLNEILSQVKMNNNKFTLSTLSTISYQKDTFNINLLKYNPYQQHRLLILTGIHGTETAGVSAVPKIVREIAANDEKYRDWSIEIVFPLNPVGLKLFSRLNECGCDINRDFKVFKTIQAQLIKELFQDTRYDVVLDLHEAGYSGHAILTNDIIDKKLIQSLDSYLIENDIKQSKFSSGSGRPLETFVKFYKYHSFLADFGETKLLAQFANDYKIKYITSESDAFSTDYDMRENCHLLTFKGIINYYQTIEN